ncbi:hypothetical protein PRIPAC_85536 [Pristionchus pacificus]|uniref:Uncharacterized protein n=1 Tax=Pristionchus pacificus TaxID=54126 RepID=A0A2A6CCR9_PRIPA|nr:hypothetical protein PRIPAC_85536 [Pristionchus pacificus]|eukprot:PDM75801.1 hypothetical protein PRIPAC_40180 [Pristionchus pacificus]
MNRVKKKVSLRSVRYTVPRPPPTASTFSIGYLIVIDGRGYGIELAVAHTESGRDLLDDRVDHLRSTCCPLRTESRMGSSAAVVCFSISQRSKIIDHQTDHGGAPMLPPAKYLQHTGKNPLYFISEVMNALLGQRDYCYEA